MSFTVIMGTLVLQTSHIAGLIITVGNVLSGLDLKHNGFTASSISFLTASAFADGTVLFFLLFLNIKWYSDYFSTRLHAVVLLSGACKQDN